nr:malonyl-coenzyme A:anthocyanin 3-O-glucoside-6''-O-malonyltransferase-like [Tanacetum cinerariifolium]
HQMASLPILTVPEHSHVSPLPDSLDDKSLQLTFFYFNWLRNLLVYPTPTKQPEICYVEGDSVALTFADNLDFNELTGNHPRNCDKFYHLVPLLGDVTKLSDYIKIPLFSIQVTLFPNQGIAIGITKPPLAAFSSALLFLRILLRC